MNNLKISDRIIGEDYPVFIIAELSCNHLQDYDLAVKTIKAAKEAGVDAIKLQTITPDTLTIDCDNEYFQIQADSLWDGQTLYDLYSKTDMPWEWEPKLRDLALDLGLIFFSSVVDKSAVDFLEELEVPAYKIPSFEIFDIPLLEYVASKGKPIILSTGIATLEDINNAVNACKSKGNEQIGILKCISLYPTPLEEMNLITITDLKKRFNTVVGLSDHSLDITPSILAVALGAKIIEKHIILDRKLGGPDAEFSLNPVEFKLLVKEIRKSEKALGKPNYELNDELKKNKYFARSLFVVEDIEEGEELTEINIRSIRPGIGLPPIYYNEVIGKKAKQSIKRGTPLSWDLIQE